ncbi:MAG: hypothetical protein COA78_29630 [Blastopirellula sp.]|nr:MAG: hypothetical protein COA78_29630 [Blastopirellula sp.]
MNPSNVNLVHELFRTALDSTVAAGPHFIDKDELLISWSIGELDGQQRDELITHMSECSYCRKELARMVKAEALILPEIEAPEIEAEPASIKQQGQSLNWEIWPMIAATAAMVVLLLWSQPTQGPLFVAQSDLESGNAQLALSRLETLLDENKLSGELQIEAERMMQKAGYQLALGHLERQEYTDVIAIEHRVTRRVSASPRLWNLKIQAERALPNEFAFAMNDTLLDHGFNLDGTSYVKSFPIMDEASEKIGDEFYNAVTEFPNNVQLRVNYGHFLIEQRQLSQAQDQFNEALKLNPEDTLANLGLGFVSFELKQYDAAIKNFEAVLQQNTTDPQSHINLAIVLEKMNRSTEAHQHLSLAAKLTKDKKLRERIQNFLYESK